MNQSDSNPVARFFYAMVIVLAFLLMAGAVWLMIRYTSPLPAGYFRSEERRTATLEMQSSAQKQLSGYEVLKPDLGQVRLPIDRAMELVVQEWEDPGAGQSALIERWELFNPPPPPLPPPQPSEYE
jgi:hypothetical protein